MIFRLAEQQLFDPIFLNCEATANKFLLNYVITPFCTNARYLLILYLRRKKNKTVFILIVLTALKRFRCLVFNLYSWIRFKFRLTIFCLRIILDFSSFRLEETDISYQQSSSRNMHAVNGVNEKMYARDRLRREMELEMEELHRLGFQILEIIFYPFSNWMNLIQIFPTPCTVCFKWSCF